MEYCNLANADLSGENLSNAWLWGANLSWANLQGANLSGATLTWANLASTDLSNADLSFTNLSGADLIGADLEGACLEGAEEFIQIDFLGEPILDECSESEECSFVDTNNDGYDDASHTSGFILGYSDGVIVGMESVDITIDNEEVYNSGFSAGVSAVDLNNDGLVDKFPIISIINGSAQVLIQNSSNNYMDSGASCSDQEDGNITFGVEVSGAVVNISNPGTYILFYNCTDSDGNNAQTKHRTVFVISEYMFVDVNLDGLDDYSYETGAQSGDGNLDGTLNIIDIVFFINEILSDE